MPNTKITKDRLKNHWAYSKKIYIFMTLVAVGLASIMYTVATNRNPADYKMVGIALVSYSANTTPLDEDVPKLLSAGQEYDSNLEKVMFLNIQYDDGNSDSELAYYGLQVYQIQLASDDCDIFIQSEALTKDLLDSDILVALDTLPSFELFQQKYPSALVWTEKEVTSESDDDEDSVTALEKHVYYIDVSSLMGLIEKDVFYVTDKYASVLLKSANPDTSLYILYNMFELYSTTSTGAQN